MTKIKSTAKASRGPRLKGPLVTVRKTGGNNEQAHWLDRLTAVMKRRAKAEKKPATR